MTIRELYNHLKSVAQSLYDEREAEAIARMLLLEKWGVSRGDMILDPEREHSFSDIEQVVRELSQGCPVQYIIGEADFCDFRVVVREGVLIPRPESEELISWILSKARIRGRILDLGCGSGALAIALSRAFPIAQVWGVDISDEALSIACENGSRLAPAVEFIRGDILSGVESLDEIAEGEFDLIISNPPYIPLCELDAMRCNVVDYEPHLALFVPDDDPLLFYRAVGLSAQRLLRSGGELYFEIHESFAPQMEVLLGEQGYIEISIREDINGKARMICAVKK